MKKFLLCVLLLYAVDASAGLREDPVASLPTAPAVGTSRLVTDGINEADCLVGGGNKVVLCTYRNGTWAAGGGSVHAGAVFPLSPGTGDLFLLTSDSAPGDCTVGGGSAVTLCYYDGVDWAPISSASVEADTLDTVFDRGKIIDGANSLANAVRIGDGSNPMCHYTDSGLGAPVVRPCTDANVRTLIPANFTWCWYDLEAGACMFTVDPDAASANLKYQYASGARPEKVIRVALSPRGAATMAEESIVTNQPKSFYATLTDANTDAVDFALSVSESFNHITTLTVRLYGVSKNASPSGNIELDCAVQSFRPSTDTFAAHSTTGEQPVVLTPATQNRQVAATSAAITINGTVATGAVLYGSCEVDATNTTSAQMTDFRLWGFADVRVTLNGPSD